MNALLERFVELQIRRPSSPLGFATAVTPAFAVPASKLELRTRDEARFPFLERAELKKLAVGPRFDKGKGGGRGSRTQGAQSGGEDGRGSLR
jgi:hypothetical protein